MEDSFWTVHVNLLNDAITEVWFQVLPIDLFGRWIASRKEEKPEALFVVCSPEAQEEIFFENEAHNKSFVFIPVEFLVF